jgi:predicted nuclease with TOPRIM domain
MTSPAGRVNRQLGERPAPAPSVSTGFIHRAICDTMTAGLGNEPQGVENKKIMSTLDEAREHLEQAINRLDGAIDRRLEATCSQAGGVSQETLDRLETERARLAGELDSLRGEHAKLSDALNDAQKNYAASKVVDEAVAVRLDSVIGQLKTVLEG